MQICTVWSSILMSRLPMYRFTEEMYLILFARFFSIRFFWSPLATIYTSMLKKGIDFFLSGARCDKRIGKGATSIWFSTSMLSMDIWIWLRRAYVLAQQHGVSLAGLLLLCVVLHDVGSHHVHVRFGDGHEDVGLLEEEVLDDHVDQLVAVVVDHRDAHDVRQVQRVDRQSEERAATARRRRPGSRRPALLLSRCCGRGRR